MPKNCARCGQENKIQAAACEKCAATFNAQAGDLSGRGKVVVFLIAVAIVGGAMLLFDRASDRDSGREVTCRRVREARAEIQLVSLTPAEEHAHAVRIYEHSQASDDERVRREAINMRDASAAGDTQGARQSLAELSAICS